MEKATGNHAVVHMGEDVGSLSMFLQGKSYIVDFEQGGANIVQKNAIHRAIREYI